MKFYLGKKEDHRKAEPDLVKRTDHVVRIGDLVDLLTESIPNLTQVSWEIFSDKVHIEVYTKAKKSPKDRK